MSSAPQPQVSSNETVWQHPIRSGVKICLTDDVATLLAESSLRALTASDRHEVGGLLLGIATATGSGLSIVITGAELVASEGRLYHATAGDEAALIKALGGRGQQAESTPIGYFRTDLEDRFFLTDREKLFIERHLPSGTSVSMLIRPFSMGVCMAGIFLWENDRLEGSFTDFEMPLFAADAAPARGPAATVESKRLPLETKSERVETPAGPPSKPVVTPPSPAMPVRSGTQRDRALAPPRRNLAVFKAVAAFCIGSVLAISALYLYQSWRLRPTLTSSQPLTESRVSATPHDLGLRVSRPANGQLDIAWDRSLPVTATGAQLEIVEDAKHRTINLDQAQLRVGKLTYFSNAGEISFRLNVAFSNEPTRSEYMVVLASTETQHESQAQNTPAHGVSTVDQTALRARNQRLEAALQILRARDKGGMQPGAATIAGSVPGNAAPPAVQPAAPVRPTELPDAAHSQPDPQAAVVADTKQQTPTPAAASTGGTTVTNSNPGQLDSLKQAAPNSLMSPASRPAAVSRRAVPSQARPTLQFKPQIPAWIPKTDLLHTRIAVDVTVDKYGDVAGARVSSGNNLSLTGPCIKAAKQWRFTPARVNGQAVASTYTIVFLFQPGNQ